MLKGQTSTFYYNRLAGKGYNFNYIIYKSKYHIEIKENKQQYILEWRDTIFLRIIIINLGILQLNYL